jgi:hypothetical protein
MFCLFHLSYISPVYGHELHRTLRVPRDVGRLVSLQLGPRRHTRNEFVAIFGGGNGVDVGSVLHVHAGLFCQDLMGVPWSVI